MEPSLSEIPLSISRAPRLESGPSSVLASSAGIRELRLQRPSRRWRRHLAM